MEIYLDNAATTVCCPEAAAAVMNAMLTDHGNPSSLHTKGVEAERLVRRATETLAGILKCREKEIYYTSGGTESDNWALVGAARANARSGKHIITTAVEHPAVSETCRALREEGFDVTVLPVDRAGRVTAEQVAEAMREDTILVSVMMVNNEIGTVEPVRAVGEAVHAERPEALFHVDAVQAFGKIPVYPKRMGIDLLSVSGHKFHGPKGIGFLYADEHVKLRPLIFGGGQQKGMRSGTDNVPGIAGIGEAAAAVCGAQRENMTRMYRCRKLLAEGLLEMEDVVLHGPAAEAAGCEAAEDEESLIRCGAPHILNASFLGVRSEVLLHTLEEKGIYVSSGSACSSHKRTGSPTLAAIGCSGKEKESALRFSFSGLTTEEEIGCTLQEIREAVPVLRRFTRR